MDESWTTGSGGLVIGRWTWIVVAATAFGLLALTILVVVLVAGKRRR